MSLSYKSVGWNNSKKRYDRFLVLGIVLFLAAFASGGWIAKPNITIEILLMRGFAAAAFFLLHIIMAIGPLARLDARWIPLLYNRRHMGVSMFLLAVLHSVFAVFIYHTGSEMNPILSILTTDAGWRMTAAPFQAFGLAALVILFVMAATSHDFWLANLTPPVWKTLHMGVYIAYLLLLAHVAFGVLQSETAPGYVFLVISGFIIVAGLHLAAGWKQRQIESETGGEWKDGFVNVCPVNKLVENVPFGATIGGERVAILLYEGNRVNCVSGVCQHQNGPLAEGRFVYGCLTCPWHGYQYKPDDGRSPKPFAEKIPTFEVRVEKDRIWVQRTPNPAGTAVPPALIDNHKPSQPE